ncbi:MAG: GlsB/YeaQ/YmgE family stress response membrane protein [Candidatus Acidiferrales bacterium]
MNNLMNNSWLWIVVIGIVAGFLAGKVMRGKGFGLIVDLLLGIVGSFLGGWVFTQLGIAGGGLAGQLLMALVGALLLLFIVRLIKKA